MKDNATLITLVAIAAAMFVGLAWTTSCSDRARLNHPCELQPPR